MGLDTGLESPRVRRVARCTDRTYKLIKFLFNIRILLMDIKLFINKILDFV